MFTPENVAKCGFNIANSSQVRKKYASTRENVELLNSDFQITNMQLKFIIFVGAYIMSNGQG